MSANNLADDTSVVQHETGVIAVIVGGTGNGRADIYPVVAIAWGPLHATDYRQLQRRLVCFDLGKPEDMPWPDFWKFKGYELRCMTEHWSKNPHVLDWLQNDGEVTMVNDSHEFAKIFNGFLEEAERGFDKTIVVTNAPTYHTCAATAILKEEGFPLLTHTRAGKYRWSYDLDSYIMGLANMAPDTDWKVFDAFKTAHIVPHKLAKTAHSSYPDDTAMHVLVEYLAAVKYAQTQGSH